MNGGLIGLLTGPIGIGKTTVAERVVGLARQKGLACGGLLAPALTDSCGVKAGIWGIDVLTGERHVLARTDRELDGPQVGVYSFDAAMLAWAITVMERAIDHCDLLIVDEIGKLELWSNAGLVPILPRLAGGEVNRSLVVVRELLLAELQGRLGQVEQVVFEVNPGNRDQLPPTVLACLFGDKEFDN
jgi:nucleoside-triphosphatase THEP1